MTDWGDFDMNKNKIAIEKRDFRYLCGFTYCYGLKIFNDRQSRLLR